MMPLGCSRSFGDASERLAFGRQIVDGFLVLFLRAAFPVVAFVERIGEVEAAVGADPDVVRGR